ncbi:uncharacterized protein si:ch211-276i12.4 [Nerophis ophidion]|uniref:uncharacterized protein si:ch211-276i12.4 n=1 Tax=Nerophis ophidion TaxID=159077 RepID=UPI002ADFEF09|nr:uncharacterized protein si:ch211-276i12.4 [Nerophis ophidion]
MEKYFRPVHSPSGQGEMKLQKHHHPEDQESHSFTLFEDSDVNQEENHHLHGNDHYPYNNPHRHPMHQTPHNQEDEILYNHGTPVTLSRASSSSLSSSSSSFSSSSWYTEASANNAFSLRHAERPPHSLSCSNIPDVRRVFREEDSSEPVVFATVNHGSRSSVGCHARGSSQQKTKAVYSALDRGHSRSEDGLLEGFEGCGGIKPSEAPSSGQLYKTSSLTRSLAFTDEDILLGDPRGPKRAVSSSQLPSKGILKNKEPHADIRKAKSMEVISPRVPTRQAPRGQKGTGIDSSEIERVRENVFQGKLQFSAFLDEITKQVISPSYLTMMGANNNKTSNKPCAPAPTLEPVKPQLPPKKNRKSFVEKREEYPKHNKKQEKGASGGPGKLSDCSNPDKLISYAARSHQGSPLPHHYRFSPSHNTNQGKSRKEKRMPSLEGFVSENSLGVPHLTDGTSSSPEPSQPKQRHHHSKQQTTAFHSPHTHYFPQPHQGQPSASRPGHSTAPPSSAQRARPGLGSESSSSKSDSSRTRETASSPTSPSSEHSGRHHSESSVTSKRCRDRPCDSEQLQVLREENSDLHQNLLQTVVCIESLESELQRTRDELSNVKEKYKSLLECHSGSRAANNLPGDNLHIAAESVSSDRKYLLSRVSDLTSELEDAHRTIESLQNINLPSLMKDLLQKHLSSTESVPTTPIPSPHAPRTPQWEDAAHACFAQPETAATFAPFKKEAHKTGADPCQSAGPLEDISAAIYEKILARYTSVSPHDHPKSSVGVPLRPRQLHDGPAGKGEVLVTLLEQDAVDVTSMSAQQILDEFMQQMHTHQGEKQE